jgi:hypothetical protein
VTGLLRYWLVIIVAMGWCIVAPRWAHAAPPSPGEGEQGALLPETWPVEWQPLPEDEQLEQSVKDSEAPVSEFGEPMLDLHAEVEEPPSIFWPSPRWLGLRHSSTHGRHVGRGSPLAATSWKNRPFYVGGELGTIWLHEPIADNISEDVDVFGGFFLGCDFDHYWGLELRFDWATPELKNSEARDADRTDSLFIWNYSFLYYPWGDSLVRPYWRAGIGDTRFDFPLDDGSRHDEWLLTFPLGFGVKYPVKRWLAARAELCDQLAIGRDEFETQHNLTLTFGLEWHFGAHPRSYWPWNPDRHIW